MWWPRKPQPPTTRTEPRGGSGGSGGEEEDIVLVRKQGGDGLVRGCWRMQAGLRVFLRIGYVSCKTDPAKE